MDRNERAETHPLILPAPAYPRTSREIYTILKQAVEEAESGGPEAASEMMLNRFAALTGTPESTMHDWFHGDHADPIRRFLCALERLSSAARAGVLDLLCRDCPRLDHPSIVQSPAVRTGLAALVEQRQGLTIVSGPSDWARTFLFTAIGNSLAGRASASGFDVHHPDRFVPIPGVWYLARPIPPNVLAGLLRRLWPSLVGSKASLLFLNGVWSACPGMRSQILGRAENRHVIVADAPTPISGKHRFPVSELMVRPSSRDSSRIEVAIRAL